MNIWQALVSGAVDGLCAGLLMAVAIVYGLGIIAADLRNIYMDWRNRQPKQPERNDE